MSNQFVAANRDSRRYARMASDSDGKVVICGSEGDCSAVVVDESFGGIGLCFERRPDLAEGQIIQFARNGVQAAAFVRHVNESPLGETNVGIEWLAEGLAREIRDMCALRTHVSSDERLEKLLQILPGGVSMMWKLQEAEKWDALDSAVERLRCEASRCRAGSIVAASKSLTNALQQDNRKQATAWAIFALVRECLALLAPSLTDECFVTA